MKTVTCTSLFLLLALALTGCGWGYASDTLRPDDGPPKEERRVVIVEDVAPTPPVVEQEPCEVEVIKLYRIEGNRRVTRELQCITGKVISESVQALDEAELRSLIASSRPQDAWYLLVDPNGHTPNAISNKQLMALHKRFALKYHQRDETTGLIIYRFEELGATP